jgi:hypothetical protein
MPKSNTKKKTTPVGYTPPSDVPVERAESPEEARRRSLHEGQYTLKQLIEKLQTIAKEAGEDVPCWTIEFGGITRLYEVDYEKGTGVVMGQMF